MKNIQVKELNLEDCLQPLPKRSKDAHKGDFGHVLILGGNDGMGGAVQLAGLAALRSGAGLVSIGTRFENSFAIAGNSPTLMCRALTKPEDLERLMKRATVIVLGPGLGQDSWAEFIFDKVIESKLPIVLDADGLNLLASNNKKIKNNKNNKKSYDHWILTPHAGEAARLLKKSSSDDLRSEDIQKDRIGSIQNLQNMYPGTLVLKGAKTLIMGHDSVIYQCNAGNPGMATAGMGDVLSGIIAALVAQGLSSIAASKLGVMVHAIAGDMAASKEGERGMIATDLLPFIRKILNPS